MITSVCLVEIRLNFLQNITMEVRLDILTYLLQWEKTGTFCYLVSFSLEMFLTSCLYYVMLF